MRFGGDLEVRRRDIGSLARLVSVEIAGECDPFVSHMQYVGISDIFRRTRVILLFTSPFDQTFHYGWEMDLLLLSL
jgi:hypothetical protein